MSITEETAPFLEAFKARQEIPGAPSWLAGKRDASIQRFAELGFPRPNQEAWRFTDLRPLKSKTILPGSAAPAGLDKSALTPFLLAEAGCRIVLANGFFVPELSEISGLPAGAWLGSTAEASKTKPDLFEKAFAESDVAGAQPFASLNAGLFADGFVLALDPSTIIEKPIEILYLGSGNEAAHLRNLIIAGAGSQATIVESAVTGDAGWRNLVTGITVAEGAKLRHIKIQAEGKEGIHTALIRASVGKEALYESFLLTVGARLSREDIQVAMAGENAKLVLNGAYLLRGDQEATFVPYVDHQTLGGQTDEVFKGVVRDSAHGVFQGTVTVRPGADQTNANQLNRNLLLSPTARIDTKPELEIFADDVKCSHGATVGSLDESALFYLQARGIDEPTAYQILIDAFAADVIDRAELGETLTAHLKGYLKSWLDAPKGAA